MNLTASNDPAVAMRKRLPGHALLEKVVVEYDAQPRRNALSRFCGAHPLAPSLRSWYVGALGEQEVARRLERLPAGWSVFHSLPIGPGDTDIDHVVIGPPGVFAINTKRHVRRRVWIGDRTLLVGGQIQPYVVKAEAEGRRLSRLLERAGVSVPVHPVLAFVGLDSLTVRTTPQSVVVVGAERLVRALSRRRTTLSDAEVGAIVARLNNPASWPPTAVHTDLASRFAAIHGRVVRASQLRRFWAFVLAATAVLGAVLLLPMLERMLLAAFTAAVVNH